jgi:hypothetical protein
MTRPGNAPSYEEDFVAWLEDQARRARRGEAGELDLDNIAEKLEGMARSDRREIRNRLIVLLIHLLKYSAQPRRRSSGWLATIAEDLKSLSVAPSDEQRLTILRRVIGRMHEAAQLERFWRKRAHPLAAERKATEQRLRLDLREVENGEPRAEQSQRSCGRQSGT